MEPMDYVILIGFLPTLALILWMIWHEEKIIRFEQKVFRVFKAIIFTFKEEITYRKEQKILKKLSKNP